MAYIYVARHYDSMTARVEIQNNGEELWTEVRDQFPNSFEIMEGYNMLSDDLTENENDYDWDVTISDDEELYGWLTQEDDE